VATGWSNARNTAVPPPSRALREIAADAALLVSIVFVRRKFSALTRRGGGRLTSEPAITLSFAAFRVLSRANTCRCHAGHVIGLVYLLFPSAASSGRRDAVTIPDKQTPRQPMAFTLVILNPLKRCYSAAGPWTPEVLWRDLYHTTYS
jgi:hypothetical protein